MQRAISFVYGTATYLIFFATFLYLIAFVGDLFVPLSVGRGTEGSLWTSIAINVSMIGLFAVQHTIMARPAFKQWWTQIVPAHLERSTFVLVTSGILWLMYTQWQPLTGIVWSVEHPVFEIAIYSIFGLGWGVVLLSTFMIDHFDLFGLRQSLSFAFGRTYRSPRFVENRLYNTVRHPLMLGFMLAFWAAPEMTVGRLVFAVTYTVYIVLAVRIEERDLVRAHGTDYVEYQQRVPQLLPVPRRRVQRETVSA